ncbi:DegT/DnrJ/EryC1/StrS family aminotransferase [Janibacter cremeus]|uniref:DegT/DnrJ/EryC1/StrS family aminotransferase n=1 Tax=Janibacter cremeus TaxID=1285192 RepID=UPI0023F9ECBA|nr:DegT/DnrJ/EryC1/StrS family aminotransferase [Janibacter cremeus]WEV78216.1 DegT/DnrJ/EryC1/StrS family aminotransferase [Janibacter cremeus]WEV78296.1 DegT/DnrJ/EryC1/StrS family aminotransferase [Janibacter cremeus]
MTERETAAVAEAVASGWLTSGPQVAAFEAEFARFVDGGHAPPVPVAVNSATAGLHLALEAAGIGPGDEVIVPTWTFTATAEVCAYLGATPVLADVDPQTLNIDLDSASRVMSSNTKAIIPVHFAGRALSSQALTEFAQATQVYVIEDAAHAFPARSTEGEMVGAGGSFATVFSFYATKTLCTGEGGMVLTPDSDAASRMRTMRLHGIDRDVYDRYRGNTSGWNYDVIAPGYKYNMTDIAASLGRVQLSRSEQMLARRSEIARRYSSAFAALELGAPPMTASKGLHAWHLYVLQIPSKRKGGRDALARFLKEKGIGTSVHFTPLHRLSFWEANARWTWGDVANAEACAELALSLPIFSAMSDDQVERVISAVREWCHG